MRAPGTMGSSGSSSPVSPTVTPYLLRPTTSLTTSSPPGSHLGGDRSPVILLLQKQRPYDPRHLVSERDRYQHTRFASQHLFEPRAFWCAAFGCLLYDGATANDKQASERAFAHFGRRQASACRLSTFEEAGDPAKQQSRGPWQRSRLAVPGQRPQWRRLGRCRERSS